MKASTWSTASVPTILTVKSYSVTVTPAGVHLSLRRRNPDGTWSRLVVKLTHSEAEEVAEGIAPRRPRVIPKV